MNFNLNQFRAEFPILKETLEGQELIYFDNAATTQLPNSVIQAISNYFLHHNANVHRGMHFLAERADQALEDGRRKVQKFINAADSREIIFTRNATESINLVATSYVANNLQPGELILVSEMEHHSNFLPWTELAKSHDFKIEFVGVSDDGVLSLEDLEQKLSLKPAFVALNHVSNVTGVINDLAKIVPMIRQSGAKFLLDACQSPLHMGLDVIAADIDFLVFSAHKMFGPMGIGVLYARSDLLQSMQPFLYGGSMVKKLAESNIWADLPQKFEAGTPNVPGVVGLAAAIDFLNSQNWSDLLTYETLLMEEFLKNLQERDYLRLLGPLRGQGRVSVFSLVMDGVHAHDVADFLGNFGICVRAGHHCAQPLMARFQVPASFRASLVHYNSIDEIRKFFLCLDKCHSFFKQF